MEYNAAMQSGFPRHRGSLLIDPTETWHHGRQRLAGDTAGIEEAIWHMNLQQSPEGMEVEAGPYPERPGETDCVYYMRTGLCGFGMSCRYNHPPNRKLAAATARNRGEYPERIGQPECQYYVKTGTCKFGATCKYHHPRDKAGTAGRAALNLYPLRPNEKECAYYLRTGQCKYGATCKFHHPQPIGTLVRQSPLYTPVQSPSTPGPQAFPGGLPTWPIARAPFIQSPRWQGPTSYAPLILPHGIVPVPSWSTYPGAQLCTFFSRYGVCKFGPTCKFDHPMGTLSRSQSVPSAIDIPVVRHVVGSPSTTLASSSFSTELQLQSGAGVSKEYTSTLEARQQSSGREGLGADA